MTRTAVTSSGLDAALDGLTVADAMHDGLVSCPPSTSLREAARMLSTYRVHAIVVLPRHEADAGHSASWRVVSDLDLVTAAAGLDVDRATVGELAGGPVRCVQPGEPLAAAAATMISNRVTHAIVLDRASARPLGILSALDVARALAGYAWPDGES
jgi:CBS domain-containing protein